MTDIMELITALSEKVMPASMEHAAATLIEKIAAPLVDSIHRDTLGNLICHKKGPGESIMVTASMDCRGFVINHIGENGFLYFQPIGAFSGGFLKNQTVRLENGVHGIIRALPEATGKKRQDIGACDLYIDIGCNTFTEAAAAVPTATYGTFYSLPMDTANGRIMGADMDSLAGCAVLLMVMNTLKHSPNDIYYVFTTMKGPGPSGRGAMAAAYTLKPAAGIALCAAGTKDVPSPSSFTGALEIGKGPGVRIKEERYLADTLVMNYIRKAAGNGYTCQKDIWPLSSPDLNSATGLSDMVSIQNSRGGVPAGGVSLPVRHLDYTTQLFSRDDFIKTVELLCKTLATPMVMENEPK